MKQFYRVAHEKTRQGLWYNNKGFFTGLIHSHYKFCKNTKLEMPFDDEAVGFLSATDSIEDLYNWFSQKDIMRLEEFGFFITVYESDNFKYHNGHWLIHKDESILLGMVSLQFIETQQ